MPERRTGVKRTSSPKALNLGTVKLLVDDDKVYCNGCCKDYYKGTPRCTMGLPQHVESFASCSAKDSSGPVSKLPSS